jgi:hypothetical protein
MQKKIIVAAVATAFGLAGCSGGSSSPSTGVLLDSAIEGVSYTASPSGKSGNTDAKGQFDCYPGDTVAFKIGGIALGTATCAAVVTPLNLAGLSTYASNNEQLGNLLLFVQSLDEDDDPTNGIKISTDTANALAGKTLDFKLAKASFFTAQQTLLNGMAVNDKFGKAFGDRTADQDRLDRAREHFVEGVLGAQLGQTDNVIKSTQTAADGEVTVTRYQLAADTSLFVPYEGSNADAKKDFPNGFYPAVGSGLAFKGRAADGNLEFYGITDRGPNGDSPFAPIPGDAGGKTSITKMFPAPNFSPSIGLISIGKDGAVVKSVMPLKVDANTKINGRPRDIGNPVEIPLADSMTYDAAKAAFNANGLDTESLVYDAKNKVFWTSDEYGPFIVKINAETGVILKKYQPGTGSADLPDILKHRRANRGMEGLTMAVDGKLHGFLQSPIDPLDASNKSIETTDASDLDQDGKNNDKVKIKDFAQFARWMQFDPATETSKLYAYPLNYAIAGQKWDRNRTGSAKLGDVLALPNGKFLVIEQGTDSAGNVRNLLMLVEIPAGVTDITADGIELEKNSIDGSTATSHTWATAVTLKKTLLLDLNALGWTAEKAEGLALVDDQTVALINDNDFGLRSILVDSIGKEVSGDITACTVDAVGAIVNDGNCAAGAVGGRVARGLPETRATRLWLIKFPKALTGYSVQ